jgi:hypothetical protein
MMIQKEKEKNAATLVQAPPPAQLPPVLHHHQQFSDGAWVVQVEDGMGGVWLCLVVVLLSQGVGQ